MTTRLEKLNFKIEKLAMKKQQLEQAQLQSLSKLLLEVSKKDVNLQTLAGLIINSPSLITSENQEVWQKAGKKFLSRQRPQKIPKAPTASDSMHSAETPALKEKEPFRHGLS